MDIELIALLIGFSALAFFRPQEKATGLDRLDPMVLYIVSGVIAVYAGGVWLGDYLLIGLMITGFGVFQLIKALLTMASENGPSKGWSHFRIVYDAIRGKAKR